MVVKQFQDGKWRTAAILKIDISPYLNEKSSDFHEILYITADVKLDVRHVIKNKKKVVLDRLRVRQNVFQTMCVEVFCGVQHNFLCKLGLSACIRRADRCGAL